MMAALAFFTSRGSRVCLMYKYINAYYIQEIDWVDYKGRAKGEGNCIFFFLFFFRIFEIFFASAEHSFFNGFLRIKYVMSIFFSV